MSRLGIHHIGVSSANEGVAVRKTGADQDIFVFLADREDTDNLLRYRLTPVIYSAELVDAFARSLHGTGVTMDVHLKIDTGMHRLGVAPEDALPLAQRIRSRGTMRLTGVCTHFSSADDPQADDYTRKQMVTFNECVKALETDGFERLQIHASNTAAAVRFPEAHYNMVRIGLGLYGLYPSDAVRQAMELDLAIGVTSRITSIQEFAPGEALGYSRTYTATRKIKASLGPRRQRKRARRRPAGAHRGPHQHGPDAGGYHRHPWCRRGRRSTALRHARWTHAASGRSGGEGGHDRTRVAYATGRARAPDLCGAVTAHH
jgi:alanine racemase